VLAARCREAVFDQLDHGRNRNAVSEKYRFGAAVEAAGENVKGAARGSLTESGRARSDIGHQLDVKVGARAKLLISLALPRGLEPLFSP
jgi:hypothetical protein